MNDYTVKLMADYHQGDLLREAEREPLAAAARSAARASRAARPERGGLSIARILAATRRTATAVVAATALGRRLHLPPTHGHSRHAGT